MKRSFSIFILVISLLMVMILLRLRSISFPRDISRGQVVIYLEDFHDNGYLFKIFHQNREFKIIPYSKELEINGERIRKTTDIHNRDILKVKDREFHISVSPETHHYKEIFRRPLREIFPSGKTTKFIGGWLSSEKRQQLGSPKDLDLLADILIEISAQRLSQVIPPTVDFDGKLLALNLKSGIINLNSPVMPIILIRDQRKQNIRQNQPVNIRSGDVVVIPGQDEANDLEIKIDLNRVKAQMFRGSRGNERLVSTDITYLVVSYREEKNRDLPGEPEKLILKSIPDQTVYQVKKNRETLFIGERGLLLFNLKPDKLLDGLFIPDRIYEGGIMDFKELLDRGMVFRQDKNVYPVDTPFLNKLTSLSSKGLERVRDHLRSNHIQWNSFADEKEFQRLVEKSRRVIVRMKRKKSWLHFCREIAKLNDPYFLKGVGILPGTSTPFRVLYRIKGFSWNPAERWHSDIPEVKGVHDFYWGSLIKNGKFVEFKIQFQHNPSPLKFISVGNYAFSLDGKTYNQRNFFDGIQTITAGGESPTLYIRITDLDRFNQDISQASLRVRMDLESHRGQKQAILTDASWVSSINMVNWMPVKTIPSRDGPGSHHESARSVWYNEDWQPVFRGIKNRYFRKDFRLGFSPRMVSWNIKTSGEYLIRINGRMVYSEKDFLDALHTGRNTLIILVSINGYLKKIPQSDLFFKRENQVYIRKKKIGKSGFSSDKNDKKPDVLDINGEKLIFDSQINGSQQRFYSESARNEFQGILGSGGTSGWGLEQVFAEVYRQHPVTEIQLTLNQQWQKIVVKNLKKTLHNIKKQETLDPKFQALKKELIRSETELSGLRIEMTGGDRIRTRLIMEHIIRLQMNIHRLKTEINRIKNPFYEASMILMNPRGQIRAAACYPYDQSGMKELNGEIQEPYRAYEVPGLNRAWKWNYNPGSTAKILDSISFLYSRNLRKPGKEGYRFPLLRELMDPDNHSAFANFPRNDLKGSRMLNGKKVYFQLQNFRGHNIPPGFCSLTRALAHSYNTYFAYLALHNNRMLSHDSSWYHKPSYFISKSNIPVRQTYREYPILKFAESLLLNEPIDLLANLNQSQIALNLKRMPYDAFMAVPSRFPVNAYTPSEIAYYAIGQSDFRLTALQNALIASAILNRGSLYLPSLIQSIGLESPSNQKRKIISPDPEQFKKEVFDNGIAETIGKAMGTVVDSGTAGGVFSPELRRGRSFYAKTGTAETKFYKDHSLFVGFVTFRDGSGLIFSTIVPRSGTGAAVAGRLTASVINDIIEQEKNKTL